jgi:hypothetical protein
MVFGTIFSSILASALPILGPFLAGIVIREIAKGAAWLTEKLRGNPKTAAVAGAVAVIQDAVDAGVTAAGASDLAHPKVAAQALLNAVKDSGLSPGAKQKLLDAAQAEMQALVNPGVTSMSDGNVTANVPLPGQTPGADGK